MSFGGFLGIMGNQYHPLPWSVLKYDTGRGGYVVNLDKQQLEGAPAYDENAEPEWGDRATRSGSTTTTERSPIGTCNASGLSAVVRHAERPRQDFQDHEVRARQMGYAALSRSCPNTIRSKARLQPIPIPIPPPLKLCRRPPKNGEADQPNG
ncbi:MAG: hypothetical protein WBA40_27415 [Roseiarcus sp.]